MYKKESFKETETYSFSGRLDPDSKEILIAVSVGNTARTFAREANLNLIKDGKFGTNKMKLT